MRASVETSGLLSSNVCFHQLAHACCEVSATPSVLRFEADVSVRWRAGCGSHQAAPLTLRLDAAFHAASLAKCVAWYPHSSVRKSGP
jgi:hypothetical protein